MQQKTTFTYCFTVFKLLHDVFMTSIRKLLVRSLFPSMIYGVCLANLPLLSDTNNSQLKTTNIYIPSPSMMGLNKPATPIRQTGPLQNRIYGHPGISNPNTYNHYQISLLNL